MTKKQRANIYRKAAKFIEQNWNSYACLVLKNGLAAPEEADLFNNYFRPYGASDEFPWTFCANDGLSCASGILTPVEKKNTRITALLLMAAMVEAGDA